MVTRFFGIPQSQIVSWSVSEDAVSLDQTNAEGGTPQVTINGIGDFSVLDGKRKKITIDSDEFGKFTCYYRSAERTESGWTIHADTPLSALNTEGYIQTGTVDEPIRTCVERFLSAAGLDYAVMSNRIKIDTSTVSNWRASVAPFKGNIWEHFKRFLQAFGLVASWGDDTIIIRTQVGSAAALSVSPVTYSITEEEVEPFSSVTAYHYVRTEASPNRFYPITSVPDGLATEKLAKDSPVISVDAGKTVTVEIRTNFEIFSVYPAIPVPSDSGGSTWENSEYSTYTVVGKDNKPITVAQWVSEGGRLELEPKIDDPFVVVATLTGANNPRLAPFRLAESDGKNDYNTLYIRGTGSLVLPRKTSAVGGFGTHLNEFTRPGIIGVGNELVIDNPMINSDLRAGQAISNKLHEADGNRLRLTWTGPAVRVTRGVEPRPVFGWLAGSQVFFAGNTWYITSYRVHDGMVTVEAVQHRRLFDIASSHSPDKIPVDGYPTLEELSRRHL